MSQLKLTLRPPPNVDFVHGYPGIPPGTPDRPQASVKGILEVRTPLPIKAKWVRIEFRKIETLPGGGPTNTFHDYVGPSPVGLWSKQEGEEWSLLSSLDYPFSIRIPESIPPSTALENGAGIKYELLASVCTKGKSSFFQKHQSKIITTIASIIIDKHELHSTWPVYSQPETRAVTREGVTLTVERNQTCYGPGDRITVNATVKSDSLYTAILCGFEISLRESTIFRAGPYAAGKKAVPQDRVAIVAENQYSVVATLYEGMYHKLELGCAVSPDHTTTTLNSASHFDITYVVAVRALMGGEHLEMELPVVVSNWVREVSLEAVRRIGPVPSLSLTPSSATNPAMPVDRTAATFNGRARNISFASTISGGGISNAFGAGGVNGAPGHKTLGSKSSFETQSSFDTQSSFFPTLESAEFAIKNAVQEEVGEGSRWVSCFSFSSALALVSNTSQPKPTPSTGPPKNASEAVNLAHVTTEEEKARFERARARAERMQISNTPISSPSSATKTSPPLNKPTTTSSKNTPWPTTEEERLHMFNEAQRAVQRKLGLEWPLQVVPVSNTPISSPSSATKTSPLLNKPTTTSSKNTPWPTAEEERLRMFNEAQRAVQRKQGIEWPVVSPYESLLARAGYVEVQSTEADLIQQIFCVFSSVPHNFPTEALAFISPQNWIDARASAIDNNITAVGHLSSYELPLVWVTNF
ncbi:hypothetical protein C8J56DRAFT_867136 [Mycena floridula]|nr:hypothetical protein C8J56DRAFT_867136 [Mycena floridula]